MIKFTVPGIPVAQGRPRFSTKGGFARAYDPVKSRNYKTHVECIASKYRPKVLLDSEIELTVSVYREIPKSFSNKKRLAAENRELRPIVKPDIDNFVKGIKDALNGVIWKDDSQVVKLIAEKFYSVTPRVEIEIKTTKEK